MLHFGILLHEKVIDRLKLIPGMRDEINTTAGEKRGPSPTENDQFKRTKRDGDE